MAIIKTTCACDRCGVQAEMKQHDYHPEGWKQIVFRLNGSLQKGEPVLCPECMKFIETALLPIRQKEKECRCFQSGGATGAIHYLDDCPFKGQRS